MNCTHCSGLGYTEEKTGVVLPHIPYIEETYKELCDLCNCTGEMMEFSEAWNGLFTQFINSDGSFTRRELMQYIEKLSNKTKEDVIASFVFVSKS